MSDYEDRLRPRDGLNNYSVAFARMQPQPGGAEFVFAVTDSMQPAAEFAVVIPFRGQGLDRMMVEAHDGLIDILRQLVFRADKTRTNYERHTRRAPAPCEESGELCDVEFL